MQDASSRQHRVRIERRAPGNDGHGNLQVAYAPYITEMWASFLPLNRFTKEVVDGGQLISSFRGTLTLLRSALSAGIVASDRVVFVKGPYTGRIAQIRAVIPSPDNAEMELALEEGAPT